MIHEPLGDGLFRFCNTHAIEEVAVDQNAVIGICEGFFFDVATADHFHHGNAKFFGKFIVACIVGRNGHDRARAVAHEHIVAHPDRHFFARHRVDGADTVDLNARLVFGKLGAFKVALFGGFFAVGNDGIMIGNFGFVIFNHGMLGADDHIGCPKEGIRTGGVDAQFVFLASKRKVDLRPFTATNPVALLGFDLFDKIDMIKSI